MRLIDADALRKRTTRQYDLWVSEGDEFAAGCRSGINQSLSCLDAAPVVRCEECVNGPMDHDDFLCRGCTDFDCFERRRPCSV